MPHPPPSDAAQRIVDISMEMHAAGTPLMRRILPADQDVVLWDHYPDNDCVDRATRARYFYHCHPPEERGEGEHGHFHLFLPLSAFPDQSACLLRPADGGADHRADVVHIAALSVTPQGLPCSMFTVNRWVTDEWLFPAQMIVDRLDAFVLDTAPGDLLVNAWLTAMVALARPIIADLLHERDERLCAAGWAGDDQALEILSTRPLDLQQMVEEFL